MARENRAFINGKIQEIRYVPNKENPTQLVIAVNVIRRPEIHSGNKSGTIRNDTIALNVRNQEFINYIMKKEAAAGDFVIASGTYCVKHRIKKFKCEHCGNYNLEEGVTAYVHPLFIQLYELVEKEKEDVKLEGYEKWTEGDEFKEIVKSKMKCTGDIISITKEKEENDDRSLTCHVVSRKPIPDKMEKEWMEWIMEVSNFIYVIGNVCNQPSLKKDSKDRSYCSYQIAVNRKVYIPEDEPEDKTDFPWIKTLGTQAVNDISALRTGSKVAIEGAIQKRQIEKRAITCKHCNESFFTNDETMEIVPYSVEYLENYTKIGAESDDEIDLEADAGEQETSS